MNRAFISLTANSLRTNLQKHMRIAKILIKCTKISK